MDKLKKILDKRVMSELEKIMYDRDVDKLKNIVNKYENIFAYVDGVNNTPLHYSAIYSFYNALPIIYENNIKSPTKKEFSHLVSFQNSYGKKAFDINKANLANGKDYENALKWRKNYYQLFKKKTGEDLDLTGLTSKVFNNPSIDDNNKLGGKVKKSKRRKKKSRKNKKKKNTRKIRSRKRN
tara:strand:+ start:1139 stop:1684 length:546 start_codon:yes stop_codon:yes gene_type:complete